MTPPPKIGNNIVGLLKPDFLSCVGLDGDEDVDYYCYCEMDLMICFVTSAILFLSKSEENVTLYRLCGCLKLVNSFQPLN
jgi:hypothetical protein